MYLQDLFKDKIISVKELSPGYEDHSSDVWLIKTDKEEFILRTSKANNLDDDSIFWSGCKEIFGVKPQNVFALESVNNFLSSNTCIKVPKILDKYLLDREYVKVEKLEGYTLTEFSGQPKELLFNFGIGLAQIHKHKKDYVGNPLGTFKVSLNNFHKHLIDSMKKLIDKYYYNDRKIVKIFPEIVGKMNTLKSPLWSSFVLVDMDPTQFLTNGEKITGLVDTEAYVIAPRELDFIALEYVLDEEAALNFITGYKKILDVPDLSSCRIPYRYLYRLIEIQGQEDIDAWLNHPIRFH